MQFVAIFVYAALFSVVQGHHHCCKCCTHGENKCSLSGEPDLCKTPDGALAMCNEAAYENPTLFFPACFDDDGVLLAASNFKDDPEKSIKQPEWFSKPMSHGEGLMMMFFVSSGLAMGVSYVKSRRIVVMDSPELLA